MATSPKQKEATTRAATTRQASASCVSSTPWKSTSATAKAKERGMVLWSVPHAKLGGKGKLQKVPRTTRPSKSDAAVRSNTQSRRGQRCRNKANSERNVASRKGSRSNGSNSAELTARRGEREAGEATTWSSPRQRDGDGKESKGPTPTQRKRFGASAEKARRSGAGSRRRRRRAGFAQKENRARSPTSRSTNHAAGHARLASRCQKSPRNPQWQLGCRRLVRRSSQLAFGSRTFRAARGCVHSGRRSGRRTLGHRRRACRHGARTC